MFKATFMFNCAKKFESAVKFVLLQNLVQEQKYLSLGPKMPYLGIFELEFEKGITIFGTTFEFFEKQSFV